MKKKQVIIALFLINIIIISLSCTTNVKETADELYKKAKFYEYYGNTKLAIKKLEQAKQKNPKDINVLYKLAGIYSKIGMYEKSKSLYKEIINLNPKYYQAYIGLGNICYYQNQYKKAIIYWKKAVEINPELRNDQKSYFNNIGMNVIQKPFDRVEKDEKWKEKVGLNKPDMTMANMYGVMGKMYYERGLYELAIKEWKKVIKIAPNSYQAKQAMLNIKEAENKLKQ